MELENIALIKMELNICYQFCLISFMLLLRRKKSQQSALSFSGLTVQAVVHIHNKVPKSRIHSVMYCDLGVGKWNHFPKSLLLLVIVTAIEGELRYMIPPHQKSVDYLQISNPLVPLPPLDNFRIAWLLRNQFM